MNRPLVRSTGTDHNATYVKSRPSWRREPNMPARSCPRCGEVVQYVADPRKGGAVCPVCGEQAEGEVARGAIRTMPAAPGSWSPPIDPTTEDEESLERPAPDYALATPQQIGMATFFAGPLAGWLLIARNYQKTGRPLGWWLAAAMGVLITVGAVSAAVAVPDLPHGGNIIYALILCSISYGCAQALQGGTITDHQQRGGLAVSKSIVFGYCMVSLVLLLGGLFIGFLVHEVVLGDQTLAVNPKEDVLYARDVTREEAFALGKVLEADGFFDGKSEKNVRLEKDGEEYVVSVFLKSSHQDAAIHQYVRGLAEKISRGLDSKPVRIDLCDLEMNPKKKLPAVRAE